MDFFHCMICYLTQYISGTAIYYRIFLVREKACSFSVHLWENNEHDLPTTRGLRDRAFPRIVYQSARCHIPEYSEHQWLSTVHGWSLFMEFYNSRSTNDFYTYRRICVLVVQPLVTRCRACSGAHYLTGGIALVRLLHLSENLSTCCSTLSH
jgi:hypothetical protein